MSQAHWEKFYRGGALASVPLGPERSYTAELREIWTALFARLPESAWVLDVGTGNGAVALIARETAAACGRHFTIHATDLAQIDPLRDVPGGDRLFTGIQFHPGVPTEQLPFETASFDAVCGQYALEYTDCDKSLPEIHRVLKSGGCAQFVLHHSESIVALRARESLRHSALVLEQTMAFRKLRRYLEAARRTGAATRRTRDELAAAIAVLRDAATRSTNPLTLNFTIAAIQQLLDGRQQMTPAALDLEVGRVESELRASRHRLHDLLQFAQTETGMHRLGDRAVAAHFEVSGFAPQYHGGRNLVGWLLRLVRR